MADKGLIRFTVDADGSALYASTNRHGSIWAELLRQALSSAVERWDDPPSCLRIVLGRLYEDLSESIYGGSVGFSVTESDHEPILVDLHAQTVDGVGFLSFIRVAADR